MDTQVEISTLWHLWPSCVAMVQSHEKQKTSAWKLGTPRIRWSSITLPIINWVIYLSFADREKKLLEQNPIGVQSSVGFTSHWFFERYIYIYIYIHNIIIVGPFYPYETSCFILRSELCDDFPFIIRIRWWFWTYLESGKFMYIYIYIYTHMYIPMCVYTYMYINKWITTFHNLVVFSEARSFVGRGAVEEMCRWIVSFPVATRNFLRQNPGELAELEGDSEEFWLVGWLVGW